MRVLLFGRLRDVAGWTERVLDPPPASLEALRTLISSDHAALGEALRAPGVMTAVDLAIVRGDVPLSRHMEVAFMPPMSGG